MADQTESILTSTVHKVDAYICRDGSLFCDATAAETYEQQIIITEVFEATRSVVCDSIPASGGLYKFRLESKNFDAIELRALAWKQSFYGYNPHISTIVQSQGHDGPWSCILTRWSKC